MLAEQKHTYQHHRRIFLMSIFAFRASKNRVNEYN